MTFRLAFVAVFATAIAISGVYRSRARAESETIPRRAEGTKAVLGRMLLALPLLVAILMYVFLPGRMSWASLDLPEGARWFGVLIGAITIPMLIWVFRSIGSNISETVLTKEDHELVKAGPYRWVRHPLYATGLLLILSLGLIAGSWVLIVLWMVGVVSFRFVVIPAEEAKLVEAFGDDYLEFMNSTGALLPRLSRPRHS